MRAAIAAVLLLLASGACRKEAPAHPGMDRAALAELDALWALAPANAAGGIVASARGVAMLEGAAGSLQAAIAIATDLPEHRRKLDEQLRKELGTASLTRAEFGIAKDRGAAVFFVGDDAIVVLALADRARFLSHTRGTKGADGDRIGELVCKPVQGRYGCAKSAAQLETLGKGDLKAKLATAGARGDIEVVGEGDALQAAAAVQLTRGAATVRGTARIKRGPEVLSRFTAPPARPRVGAEPPAGFVVANLTGFAADVPPIPLGGTTLDAVAKSLQGPLTISVPGGGSLGFDLQQGLADPAPMRALIEHCPELLAIANLQATSSGGICKVFLLMPPTELELAVTGQTLRIGTRPAAGKPVPVTALGGELAAGAWTYAAWGRGAVFGLDPAVLRAVAQIVESRGEEGVGMLHALAALNELGVAVRVDGDALRFVLGVRTAFANPDVVVAQLSALTVRQIFDGSAAPIARRIAATRPKAPLAADLDSGPAGYLAMAAALGVPAGIAIPMFLDAQRGTAPPEAPPPSEIAEPPPGSN
jgi:hypothetical protein